MGISDFLQNKKKEKAMGNLKDAEDFLLENGKKEGIITTASGLQYEVITAGDGKQPQATSQVTVHYEGKLLNGTTFDSSYRRNQPATFPLNRVISGWTEGLQLMKENGKYRFYIHPTLGYGAQQVGSDIAPNSLLIFEVELLRVM